MVLLSSSQWTIKATLFGCHFKTRAQMLQWHQRFVTSGNDGRMHCKPMATRCQFSCSRRVLALGPTSTTKKLSTGKASTTSLTCIITTKSRSCTSTKQMCHQTRWQASSSCSTIHLLPLFLPAGTLKLKQLLTLAVPFLSTLPQFLLVRLMTLWHFDTLTLWINYAALTINSDAI